MVTLDDFRQMDLRVAQITGADRIAGTERLLRVTVDLGSERRDLVAGLAGHYRPEELLGLQVIVVANLLPATIRGVRSQGMILGVGCSDRRELALVTVNREAPNGARVE